MSKVKLLHFQIAAIINESKDIIEYLQKRGIAHLENYEDENLTKYDTGAITQGLKNRCDEVDLAVSLLERTCEIKRGLIESFTDYKTISYDRYKYLSEKNEETYATCTDILRLNEEIEALTAIIGEKEKQIEYLNPWLKLDIVMASKRTLTTRIFIGQFNRNLTAERIREMITDIDPSLEAVEVEIVSSEKMLTSAVIVCHISDAEALESALKDIDFVLTENALPALPSKTQKNLKLEVAGLSEKVIGLKDEIAAYVDSYDDLRFLADYLSAQIDKYKAVELAGTTDSVFLISGFVPEKESDELKFMLENNYTACIEFDEPDYEDPETPVLLQNGSFANGVEGITEMYSPVSNKDVDPNPVMAFFYYAFFGLMLSDAGYGILMVLFSIFAEKKLKARDNMKKTVNMIFYSGISSIIFGALFGGWFGDLIPVIFTHFLKSENPPDLALWLDPVSNSITLLVYCLGFGILHLFAGLILNGYKLIKSKNYLSAIFDTLPTMIFVCGFAVFGAGFLIEVPAAVKTVGNRLLIVGAALIVLTAGRSAKNIIGKLGMGIYGLYNTASGYLGDILSYSRLLALGLVTGVIASSINLMATMPDNPILFVLIFILGHTINIAINLIGTYVHTNRLQYVEFFSKFYEGEGKVFTPFKINSKHIIIKEDK